MKKIAVYMAPIAAYLICACNSGAVKKTEQNPGNKLNDLSWLIGSWENADSGGVAYEVWNKENDTLYTAKSFYVKGNDTLPQETVQLQQNGNDLYYIPTVIGQNSGQPVPFRLTTATKDEVVFENPAHDFPQKITYRNISPDSLLAVISGNKNGKTNTEQFPMARMK